MLLDTGRGRLAPRPDPELVHRCNFHGLSLAVTTNSPLLFEAIHERLRDLPSSGCNAAELTFDFHCVPDKAHHCVNKPSGEARSVYEIMRGEVLYFDVTDELYIDCDDRARVLCNPGAGQVRMSFLPLEGDELWLVSHFLLTLTLIELLKRRNFYSLHAAGLFMGGKGLLIAGASGSGKSTLTVGLLNPGVGFLSDDMVFLTSSSNGLRMLAFPDEIDLTDETIRLIPKLHYLLDLPKRCGRPKRQIRASKIFGIDTVWECQPSVLIFPRIANTQGSLLKPVTQIEALLELAPNILLTEVHSAQAHLNILKELTSKCRCYRLQTGKDLGVLPGMLADLATESSNTQPPP